jgi:signal transduction histidine kinase
MGRLFWKFFLFIWLVQLAGLLGVSAFFWHEHHMAEARWQAEHADFRRSREFPPHPDPEHGPGRPPPFRGPPHDGPDRPPGPERHERSPIPLVPLCAALLVSLVSAFGLAWYFAKPIRHLRSAFDAAADGDLEVRIGDSMGGRRDELADLGRDFDRMSERLCALVDGQKRLLHDVSHEMRSPLARLQAAIGLARQQPARMEDSLERIEREGERMNHLVGELLTLSRLEAGVTGERESVDLGELLDNIVDDARFEGAARRVEVDYARGEMPEILANAELLHRAIENVVRNALRYSPESSLIRIEAGSVGRVFRLVVIDYGPGVSAAELDAIFTPFFRGGGQSSGGGYGLGLAIARRVVAALNGSIKARNGAAKGLVIEIELPLASA